MTKNLAYPYVEARKSANSNLVNSTPFQVNFDTITNDPYTMKGNAAGQFFVIPVTGTYIVTAAVWWNGETTTSGPAFSSYRLAYLSADPTGTGASYSIFAENLVMPNVGVNSDSIQHVTRTGTFTKGTAIKCTAQQFNAAAATIAVQGGIYTKICIAMIPGKITN
jgi:hypothetical protein